MIDLVLIFLAVISLLTALFGIKYYDRLNNSMDKNNLLSLLHFERNKSNKRSNRRREIILKETKKISTNDLNNLYQIAKKNRLSVGEVLLAVKINSYK